MKNEGRTRGEFTPIIPQELAWRRETPSKSAPIPRVFSGLLGRRLRANQVENHQAQGRAT